MTDVRRVRTEPRPMVLAASILAAFVVAGYAVTVLFGDRRITLPVILNSAIEGLVAALLAVAIVLVYRANRIITFAHAPIVATALDPHVHADRRRLVVLVHRSPSSLASHHRGRRAHRGRPAAPLRQRRRAWSPPWRLSPPGSCSLVGASLLPFWRFEVNLLKVSIEDLARLPREA